MAHLNGLGKRLFLLLTLGFFSATGYATTDFEGIDYCKLVIAGAETANPEWIKVLFRFQTVAMFEPGQALQMREREGELKKRGVDVVMIKEPSQSDLALLKGAEGYSYGPLAVTWHQPTRTFIEQLDARTNVVDLAKKKNDWKRKLRASEGKVYEEILPVNQENWTLYWDYLYKPHVADKPKGSAPVGPDVSSLGGLANKGAVLDLSAFSLVLYRENGTGKPLGGVLLERFKAQGILKTRCAAFNKNGEYRKLNLYSRTHEATARIAKAEGIATMSYGSDPNFYGDDMLDIGLLSYKAKLGYQPELWTTGPDFFKQTRVIKILNPEKAGLPHYVMFSFADPGLQVNIIGEMSRENLAFPQGMAVVDNWGRDLTEEEEAP